MFIAGIKFGIGVWLISIALVALVVPVTTLVSYVRDHFKKQKDFPKLRRTKAGYLLWTRGPMSAPHEDGSFQAFSFRTTIRWGGRENPRERRKEPHYRH